MKKKRHTPEQIIKKLRTASEEQARGTSTEEVCRELEISVAT
jgi:putative transposase